MERPQRTWTAAVVSLLLVLAAVASMWQLNPPAPVPASAPASEFSSERAMEHLKVIADAPRPGGSAAHAKVREYLMEEIRELGLQPELQTTTAIRQYEEIPFDRTGRVENVLARVKGTEGGPAVLLSAHYDSPSNSNGAAGNGAAVAALLETMRALQEGPQPEHDVIFLFVDGVEGFLTGATAFAEEHPWAKEVGLILNFDARGTAGPVVMAETSVQNGAVIREFADAAPEPVANSLMYALVRSMPMKNMNTAIFHEKIDAPSLNFMFADEVHEHRTQLDTLENLDQGSLQHQGSYALALARHFGGTDLAQIQAEDRVFFNAGGMLVHYPISWAIPLAVLAALAFIGALVIGLRRRLLTGAGLIISFLLFLVMIVAAGATAMLLAMLTGWLSHPFSLVNYDELFTFAFVFCAFAAVVALFFWASRKWGAHNLSAGAGIWWLLLTLATGVLFPEGSYLFMWPLLFASIGLGVWWSGSKEPSSKRLAVIGVATLPAFVLGAQFLLLLTIMMGNDLPAAQAIVLTLLTGLWFPLLGVLRQFSRSWAMPSMSLVTGAALLVTGLFLPAYSEELPKPHVLFYGVQTDTDKAYWATLSADDLDSFTEPLLSGGEDFEFNDFLPGSVDSYVFANAAPVAALNPPSVEVVKDETSGEKRVLHLKLKRSSDQSVNMMISMTSDQPLETATLDGKEWRNNDPVPTRWESIYAAVPEEGIDLILHLKKGQELKLNAVDVREGLPQDVTKQRPAELVPTYFSDLSYVSKVYSF